MTEQDPDCIFCKIASGEIPADIVHQDHWTVAFRDLNPKAPTHVLVIPRRHVPSVANLTDEDGELLAAMFGTIRAVAEQAGLSSYRVASNVGPDAGQSVFHLHLHLLGGRSMSWPPG
ncbi:MAG TPA: histidine triad nucleotide-binding protein [Candidatus Limnocylindrales bacterium]|nr:histidine triad nucleotide-binding protein [Candidatus Limnocylindrales bacterium]